MKFVDINFDTKRLEQDIKKYMAMGVAQKGKIGASGCGNLLLLELGFVKLAKQYCIN